MTATNDICDVCGRDVYPAGDWYVCSGCNMPAYPINTCECEILVEEES